MAKARVRSTPAACLVLTVLLCAQPSRAAEELLYEWHLTGFGGFVVGLFFPDSGEAFLVTERGPGRALTTRLEIVSPKREGEFYRYGAEIGTRGGAVRVWFSSLFRGKKKHEEEVVERGVLDFALAIHALRREMPDGARRLRLWSEGKVYPLVVAPAGDEEIRVSGQTWSARRYLVQGLESEGGRSWKGRFHLWLAFDEHRTPVRIVGERGLLTVRLDLEQVSR